MRGDALARVRDALAARGTPITGHGRAPCPAHGGADANLAVTQGDDGVLLTCHSHGCSAADIAHALGLAPVELFDAGRAVTADGTTWTTVTTYEYVDEAGHPLFRVHRKERHIAGQREKCFSQERYDAAAGRFIGGRGAMQGVRRVLYRLPELRAAVERGDVIYVCEGEQAADVLRDRCGVVTTTAPEGAGKGKWMHRQATPPYADSLEGARVVLLPDHDDAGEAHMRTAAAALLGVAASVRVVHLPGLPAKGDAVQWCEAGGDRAALEALVHEAPHLTRETVAADHDHDRRDGPGVDARPAPLALRELLLHPELLLPPPAVLMPIAYVGRVTLLSAREKTGKSTLLGQAVAAVSTGAVFLGESQSPARVLWYVLDEPLGDTVRRFAAYGGDPDMIYVQTERPTAAQLRADVEATSATLVVIDTLTELWSGFIESEKDAQDVATFTRPYVLAARELDIAIVLLHHTTKNGVEYRGSVQLGAAVDIVLTLKKIAIARPQQGQATGEEEEEDDGEDDGRRTLRGKGRGVDVNLRLYYDGAEYTLGEAPMPLRMRLLRTLDDGDHSASELADIMRVRKATVLDEMAGLRDEGLIVRRGKREHLTPHGQLEARAIGSRDRFPGVVENAPGTDAGTDGDETPSDAGTDLTPPDRGGTDREPIRGTAASLSVPDVFSVGKTSGTDSQNAALPAAYSADEEAEIIATSERLAREQEARF